MSDTIINKSVATVDFYLIGIGNSDQQKLSEEIHQVIGENCVFSGGNRHRKLIDYLLPKEYKWIPLQGNMTELISTYNDQQGPVVIFVSGDPYFYGFGNTLKRLQPKARVKTFPYFNCIQLLSNKLQLNYSIIQTVSVHGRSWEKLDQALLSNQALIGILTDAEKSPQAIAQRMLTYGFDNYVLAIGEALESSHEKINVLELSDALSFEDNHLNCVILKRKSSVRSAIGIPDELFTLLPGRPGMITKRPIRMTTLSIADIFEMALEYVAKPDTIFIGGHGNKLEEMVALLDEYLVPGGRVVMNTVKEKSAEIFMQSYKSLGYQVESPMEMQVNEFNPIKILVAKKEKQ